LIPRSLFYYCLTLLFYTYVAHPTPHSFPTRRSSDLPHRRGRPRLRGREAQDQADYCLGKPQEPALGPSHRGASEGSEHRDRAAQDRKSTRLNSSHLVISYAVF